MSEWKILVNFWYLGEAGDADDPPRQFEKEFPGLPRVPVAGDSVFIEECSTSFHVEDVTWWLDDRSVDIFLGEVGPDDVDPGRLREGGWEDSELILADAEGNPVVPGGPNDLADEDDDADR